MDVAPGAFCAACVCVWRARNSCLSWVVLACEGAVKGQTPCHVALTQCSSVVAWLQLGRAARECVNYTVVAEGEAAADLASDGGKWLEAGLLWQL